MLSPPVLFFFDDCQLVVLEPLAPFHTIRGNFRVMSPLVLFLD